jgi:hypothetical protein
VRDEDFLNADEDQIWRMKRIFFEKLRLYFLILFIHTKIRDYPLNQPNPCSKNSKHRLIKTTDTQEISLASAANLECP